MYRFSVFHNALSFFWQLCSGTFLAWTLTSWQWYKLSLHYIYYFFSIVLVYYINVCPFQFSSSGVQSKCLTSCINRQGISMHMLFLHSKVYTFIYTSAFAHKMWETQPWEQLFLSQINSFNKPSLSDFVNVFGTFLGAYITGGKKVPISSHLLTGNWFR